MSNHDSAAWARDLLLQARYNLQLMFDRVAERSPGKVFYPKVNSNDLIIWRVMSDQSNWPVLKLVPGNPPNELDLFDAQENRHITSGNSGPELNSMILGLTEKKYESQPGAQMPTGFISEESPGFARAAVNLDARIDELEVDYLERWWGLN